MAAFLRAMRLVVGVALVAGGVVLAQPFAAVVMAARQQADAAGQDRLPAGMQRPQSSPSGLPPMAVTRQLPPNEQGPWAPAANQTVVGGPTDGWQGGPEPMPGVAGPAALPGAADFAPAPAGFDGMSGAVMPPPRSPPTPPAALPRSAADFAPAAPPLDAAYRSTLDVPPPPLLDTQSPPPLAVGWTSRETATPPQQSVAGDAVQSQYTVRDGDDLTGIALRVYGSAGAAGAIWAANRDRLQDPQILPIGMVLSMPPSWTLPSAHAAQGGQAIEPTFGPAHSAASWRTTRPQAAGQHPGSGPIWLQPAAGSDGRYPAEPPPEGLSGPPGTVRVSPGDSLETIAARYYGDRTAAGKIWQANRDRLRSPDLLVPGTDLRLP